MEREDALAVWDESLELMINREKQPLFRRKVLDLENRRLLSTRRTLEVVMVPSILGIVGDDDFLIRKSSDVV